MIGKSGSGKSTALNLMVWAVWGCLVGFLSARAVYMAVCAVCYLAGCVLSIILQNRSKVLELLRDKE